MSFSYKRFSNKNDAVNSKFPDDSLNMFDSMFGQICGSWIAYLKNYCKYSVNLFELKKTDSVELPWDKGERVFVSTLATSISRKFTKSLVIEEVPVIKKTSNVKSTDDGRARSTQPTCLTNPDTNLLVR